MHDAGTVHRVVIVGAGHAGATGAIQLRSLGYAGSIDLISDEPYLPYHRPPLSKAWLLGKSAGDTIALKPPSFYADQRIALRLGCRVESVDRSQQHARLSDGEVLPYDSLILATGARARQLPWAPNGSPNVYELRTQADAESLRQALRPGARVIIIGAGYIGLEAAASARARGASVVVIEREERVLARVASPPISRFFADYHGQRGVRFRFGDTVSGVIPGSTPGTWEVGFAPGTSEEGDLLLIGVGAIPNQELGVASGLRCEDGILVNEEARTSDPAIFAIGDCARRPLQMYERVGRLESVANALEQARLAAHVICGIAVPAHEVPWFWSDQYDLKLQIAGLSFDVERHIVRGDPVTGKFAVFHLNNAGQMQAVEAVNAAPEFLAGRQLIASRRHIDAPALADMSRSMKEIAA